VLYENASAPLAHFNKTKQGRYYRALSYLQGAVAHAGMQYAQTVRSVHAMETMQLHPVSEMSLAGSTVGYPIAAVPGGRVWVGFDLTDKPGDVYRFYAWLLDDQGRAAEGGDEALRAGVESQQQFTKRLRAMLQPATTTQTT
jgi:hypothetical protein